KPNRVTRPRANPVWEPPPEIQELFGDTSGNDINGLDELEPSAPKLIMWAHPKSIAHGAVQIHMTQEFIEHPHLAKMLRVDDRHEPAPVSSAQVERAPAEWVELVRDFALRHSTEPVELCGVAEIDRSWFYEGRATSHRFAVVLGVAMDHAELATAPEYTSAMEVHRQYNRGTSAARELADWIRSQGHEAEGHGGPGAGPMLMIPAAISAGLGELGKHGSLINPEFGSSFRLACVLTDLPLEIDHSTVFGADDFCHSCRVCADACPPAAISHTEQIVRGVEKWYVDFDLCLPYFADSYGCGICIAACPWSTPGEAPRLAEIMTRRQARDSTRNEQ
ncbi:MAG: 4Fe-4S dicluster domain-containing protein, partial [Actinomycetota bacterium]|nr:4Fe-4S dicluster domain-containing protein [Actinomycetota bacterium]